MSFTPSEAFFVTSRFHFAELWFTHSKKLSLNVVFDRSFIIFLKKDENLRMFLVCPHVYFSNIKQLDQTLFLYNKRKCIHCHLVFYSLSLRLLVKSRQYLSFNYNTLKRGNHQLEVSSRIFILNPVERKWQAWLDFGGNIEK